MIRLGLADCGLTGGLTWVGRAKICFGAKKSDLWDVLCNARDLGVSFSLRIAVHRAPTRFRIITRNLERRAERGPPCVDVIWLRPIAVDSI